MRCRDAIEELHQEIEEERKAKALLHQEAQLAQHSLSETRLQLKSLQLELETQLDRNTTLQRELQDCQSYKEYGN